MAEYRQLKTAFWFSPFIMSLSPEERAFYAFMLTNPSTTHSGIYQLSIRMIVTLHGYTEEIIQGLIQKFVAWKKIAYDPGTHEFMVMSWMEHNRPCNPRILGKVGKEVRSTKSEILKDLWSTTNPLDAEKIGQPFVLTVEQPLTNCTATVERPLTNHSDTVSQSFNHNHNNNTQESLEPKEKQPTEQQETGVNASGYSSVLRGSKETFLSLGLKEQDQTVTEPRDMEENIFLKSSLTGKPEATKPKGFSPLEEQIMRYFNQQMGTGYRYDHVPTNRTIRKHLDQGFSVADFQTVIDKKIAQWRGTSYDGNLSPMGLFGKNFSTYFHQKISPHSGYSRLAPSQFTSKVLKQVF